MNQVEQLSRDILDFLETKLGKEVNAEMIEIVRLSLGLTLTSIHAAIIHSAEKHDQVRAVEVSLDTCQRLMSSIKRNVDEIGIQGFTFISSEIPSDQPGEMH